MNARRALQLTNAVVDVRPVLLLAAKALGPGSLRLELVKLIHELNERQSDSLAFQRHGSRFIGGHRPVSRSIAGGHEYNG